MCDAATGQESDANEIDTTFCTLVVDLWHEDTSRGACNLVRHSSAAPTVSISSSVTTSFPPQPERQMYLPQAQSYNMYGQAIPAPHPFGQPQYYPGQAPPGFMPNPYTANGYQQPIPAPNSSSNHTRNLIGQTSVNAFKLNDPDGKPGIWFVLQDLSVRTEGTFRYVAPCIHAHWLSLTTVDSSL